MVPDSRVWRRLAIGWGAREMQRCKAMHSTRNDTGCFVMPAAGKAVRSGLCWGFYFCVSLVIRWPAKSVRSGDPV
jgi:hypothetical protein